MIMLSIDTVKPGMKIGKAIFAEDGQMLIGKGVIINEHYTRRLKSRGVSSISIYDKDTEDIEPLENISDMVRGSTLRDVRKLFDTFDDITKEMKGESLDAVTTAITSKQFLDTFRNNPAFTQLQKDVDNIVNELINGEVTLGLNSIKTYDNYTFQHSIDVSMVAVMIGRRIGLNKKRLKELGIGCLLHDIGKVFVPVEIVNKPDKLTKDEFEIIMRHATIGYELTKGVATIGILPPHVAFQHHEKQDGSGYPRGITGNNKLAFSSEPRTIHLYGAITAVADIYDALSSDRPYRKAMQPEKVIKILQEMKEIHLNKEVLRHFFAITPVYPVGSTIMIMNGEYQRYLGIVCQTHNDALERPTVRMVFNNLKKRIQPFDLDMRDHEDIRIESRLI